MNNTNINNISDLHNNSSSCNYIDSIVLNNNTSHLNILYMNIRSLNKNYDSLLNLLDSSNSIIHIIALTETWLTDTKFTLPISDYQFVNKNSIRKSGIGGTAFYIHNSIEFITIKELSLATSDYESVTIEFTNILKNLRLTCIYRHPQTSLESFELLLNKFMDTNTQQILLGDINIDLLNTESTITQTYSNYLLSYGYEQKINLATRVTSFSSTLIDHIYMNFKNIRTSTQILRTDITDHYPIIFRICTNEKLIKTKHYFRDYRQLDITQLNRDITDINLIQSNDINLQFNNFNDKLKSIVNKHAPIRIRSSKFNQIRRPYITVGILNCIKKKQILYHKQKQSKLLADIIKYKAYKNKLCSMINLAKKNYYKREFSKDRSSKEHWKTIKKLLHNKSNSEIKEIIIDGNKLTNSIDIANGMNNYFSSVAKGLQSKFINNTNFMQFMNNNKNPVSIFFHPANADEIYNVIMKFKNKSVDLEDIPIKILKLCSKSISLHLTKLINNSFLTGNFPDALKIAIINPIHKSGNMTLPNNYRPISLLPCISKIYEKIIFSRLIYFFESTKILCNQQFGFRQHRNTEYCIIDLLDYITKKLDQSKHVVSIFLDLRKAFDCVDHSILLNKLEHYGIRGKPLDLLKSYLFQRHQKVKISNILSNNNHIDIGVPQGSILGPLLFLIYINDLPNCTNYFKINMFADDTSLSAACDNLDTLENSINTNLVHIKNWLYVNKLTLNIDKTNFIIFNKNKNLRHLSLHIENSPIENVECCKYLGVILDNKLKFKNHIAKITKIISFKLGILLQLKREKIPIKILQLIYSSLILPHLYYCNVIWSHTYTIHLNSLDKIQKRCVSLINGHTNNIFSLSKLNTYCTRLFYINILQNHNHFLHDTIMHDLILDGRNKFNLRLNHTKKNIRLKTIFEEGRIQYNSFISKHKINPFSISKHNTKYLTYNEP